MAFFSGFLNRFATFNKHISGTQIPDPYVNDNQSGITVTEDLALQQSAIFACTRLIASTIGTLPLQTYRLQDGSRELATGDALYERLKNRPNRIMDGTTFWEFVGYNLAMHGNFYAIISRRAGTIANLWPLSPLQMCVVFDAENNRLMYDYTVDGRTTSYSQSEILHIRLFGTNTVGFSPLSYAAANVGLSAKNNELASSFAKRGGKATGVFKVDKLLNPEERKQIRENIITPIESTNGHSTVLLEMGTDYKAIQLNPEELQLLESRRFSVEDLARIYGVPSVLINDSGNSTVWGSGIEQIILGFMKTTLRNYLVKIESAIHNQLYTANQRAEFVSEFDMEKLIRPDANTRATVAATRVSNGLMTRNEARKLDNLPPMEGGDQLTVQSNMVSIDQLQRLEDVGQ